MELVQSPYWRAVKEEIRALESAAYAKLTSQAQGLMDLIGREEQIGRLRAYKMVVDVVEARAANHMKRQSDDDN